MLWSIVWWEEITWLLLHNLRGYGRSWLTWGSRQNHFKQYFSKMHWNPSVLGRFWTYFSEINNKCYSWLRFSEDIHWHCLCVLCKRTEDPHKTYTLKLATLIIAHKQDGVAVVADIILEPFPVDCRCDLVLKWALFACIASTLPAFSSIYLPSVFDLNSDHNLW